MPIGVYDHSMLKDGRAAWNKGLTKETDERVMRISIAHTGIKFSKSRSKTSRERTSKALVGKTKGKPKPHSLGHRLNESIAAKNSEKHNRWTKENHPPGWFKAGEKNPRWNPNREEVLQGYSQEFNSILKERIRERDNHTCQECGFTQEQLGYKLSVHHIDYNKKNNLESNLISLCKSCHMKTEFNKMGWELYYRSKVLGGACDG